MALAPGTKLGPYEVLAPLGAGGMGEVWRARDTRLGRDVAVKVLPDLTTNDPKALARFQSETKAVAALSHPSILSIFDVGEANGIHYAVTELLEGETLRQLVARGPVPLKRALEIALQVTEGLAAAHEKGIVHRDLKPENLFLTEDGRVKILDFGLARHETTFRDPNDTHSPTLSEFTEAGAVLGTVAYMSPEQARGHRVDHRSDEFSLGTVLYEMLAGRRPFRGETSADVMVSIIREEPEPLEKAAPGVAPPIAWLVGRLLSMEPAERYDSTHDLLQELTTCRAHLSGGLVPERYSAGARSSGRRRLALVAVGLVVTALIGAGIVALRPWHRPPPADQAPSLLALPCKVYGAPEVAFLTDAVPQTLSTLLARVEGLDMKVPPTSLEVEKVKGDLDRLAYAYRVSSFVLTSLTASAGSFTLNVQLVEAGTKRVRWGQQYEGPRESYNDLARQAAEGIRLALKPSASPVPTAGVPSEAELAFREGKYLSGRYLIGDRIADLESALADFSRALELDPSLAVAAAETSRLLDARFMRKNDVPQLRTQAEAWARRALRIDPRCGEAWSALSELEILSPRANLERGLEYALRGVSLAPRDPQSHRALGVWMGGASFFLFAAANLKSLELDPLLPGPAGNAAVALTMLDRTEEALTLCDRALHVQPEARWPMAARGFVLLRLGRLAEAERELTHLAPAASARDPLSELWRHIRLQLSVALGDRATSEALAGRVVSTALDARTDANTVSNAVLFAVPALARLGRADDAMRILVRSVEAGVPPTYEEILLDPDFRLLRKDRRFETVLTASRNGATRIARVLEQARSRGELPAHLAEPLAALERQLK
jgi:tetratricopeptide (TPR) repeat protein